MTYRYVFQFFDISHCVRLKLGHQFHALLKFCSDCDDTVPLNSIYYLTFISLSFTIQDLKNNSCILTLGSLKCFSQNLPFQMNLRYSRVSFILLKITHFVGKVLSFQSTEAKNDFIIHVYKSYFWFIKKSTVRYRNDIADVKINLYFMVAHRTSYVKILVVLTKKWTVSWWATCSYWDHTQYYKSSLFVLCDYISIIVG